MRRRRCRSERVRRIGLALGFWFGFGLLSGCGDPERADGYGLTLIELDMRSDAVAELRHGAYTESPAPCRAEIGGLETRCQIRVAGSTTRDDLKKNFDLELAGEYSGRRRHRLSAMHGDPSGMRTLLALSSLALAGHEVPRAEPVALWLNDDYLGLYLLLEPIDPKFFEARDDRALALYKARNLRASLHSTHDLELAFARRVDEPNYSDLRALVEAIAAAARGDSRQLDELVDTRQVLSYMAGAQFINNWDGIFNNYFLARSERAPRFSILAWDLDQTFGAILDPDDGKLFETNALMRLLHDTDQERYRDELRSLNQLATPEVLAALVDEFEVTIREAYEHDRFLNGTALSEHAEALKRRAQRQHETISSR